MRACKYTFFFSTLCLYRLASNRLISLEISAFLASFSSISFSGFFNVPAFIFSSKVSISLTFFLRFFNLFCGSSAVLSDRFAGFGLGGEFSLFCTGFALDRALLFCDTGSFFCSGSETVVLAKSSVIRSAVLLLLFFFFFLTSALTCAPGTALALAASSASCLALCSAMNSGLAPIGYMGLFFICFPLLSYLKRQ